MSQNLGFKIKNWLEFVGQTTLEILGLLDTNGQVAYDTDKDKLVARTNNVNDPIVQEARAATLTNKTIDADSNTISNIENADIKVGAAIDAAKIANGSVSNTEYQYLDGLTSNIQSQLDGLISEVLPENNILVGNPSDVSQPVDTSVSGDILADSVNGLTYKAGSIDNADISASAAIARSKIAVGSANHVVINSGTGAFSSEAQLALTRGGSAIDNSQLLDNTTTGSAATLNAVSGYVRLTNGSLVSIASIPAAALGGIRMALSNATGGAITVINGSGILTGSGNDLNLNNNASLSLVFDSTANAWLVVGGSGSGGGSWTTYTTENISSNGTISSSLLMGFQVRRIQGNGAAVNASTTPFGAGGGWVDGTSIRLVGQSLTDTVTILNSNTSKGALLNGDCTLAFNDSLELQYDSSLDRWVEVSRSN